MLKGEHCGESKKQPLVKPYKQDVFKKSSSPVQTASKIKPSRKWRLFYFIAARRVCKYYSIYGSTINFEQIKTSF